MSRTRYIAIVILGFFHVCAPSIWSQEVATSWIDTITSIEIIGLKRTKPPIAKYPLEKFIGREGASLDLNEVYAVIKDTGTLEPLEVALVNTIDGTILQVTVQEKWSIFPVPMVMVSNGDFNYGLIFMDANALGLQDQMALGGMYGSSGAMAMAMYNHTPNRKGLPGWNTSLIYGRQQKEDSDRDEIIHRRYSVDLLSLSLELNYPFTDQLSGSLGLSFSDINLKKNENDLNPPEKGVRLLGISPGISLRSSDWDGILLSQQSISVRYGYNLGFSGSSYHKAEFRGVYERSLVPGFRLNLYSGAIWKSTGDPDTAPLFEDGPQGAHVDILPQKFSARQYVGFSVGLEKYLFKASWGTLSMLGSWQSVFSQGLISGSEFNHGLSGGIRFYLSRVAIPAMGIGLAYNLNSGLFQFTFSIGIEM